MKQPHELPPPKEKTYRRAVRLEWITIVYLISAIVFIYLTLGSSQAMKAAWLEDSLSLLPPLAFLVSAKFRDRPPNENFPYGYHRAVGIAFLVASLALFAMGVFLLFDSTMKLLEFEHPSIGVLDLFDQQVWLGWLMFPALLWSAIPAAALGRAKLPLARDLHDKVLFADAKMNKADWLTAGAAMVGVIGIAFGVWWLDPVAAAFISLDILHDGITNLRAVVKDLMDQRPTLVDHSGIDPISKRVETELKKLDWVADARVRLRELGHIYDGEVIVVPATQRNLIANLDRATAQVRGLDWKLRGVILVPARTLEPESESL